MNKNISGNALDAIHDIPDPSNVGVHEASQYHHDLLSSDKFQEMQLREKEMFRSKRSYVPVEIDKRQQLIKAVEDEGLTIKEAAQNLNINYSTAKHIVKVYKRTGEVTTTQMMNKRLPERDIRSLEFSTLGSFQAGQRSLVGASSSNKAQLQVMYQDPIYTTGHHQQQHHMISATQQQFGATHQQLSAQRFNPVNSFQQNSCYPIQQLMTSSYHVSTLSQQLTSPGEAHQLQGGAVYPGTYKRLRLSGRSPACDSTDQVIQYQNQYLIPMRQQQSFQPGEASHFEVQDQQIQNPKARGAGETTNQTIDLESKKTSTEQYILAEKFQVPSSSQTLTQSNQIMRPIPVNKNLIYQTQATTVNLNPTIHQGDALIVRQSNEKICELTKPQMGGRPILSEDQYQHLSHFSYQNSYPAGDAGVFVNNLYPTIGAGQLRSQGNSLNAGLLDSNFQPRVFINTSESNQHFASQNETYMGNAYLSEGQRIRQVLAHGELLKQSYHNSGSPQSLLKQQFSNTQLASQKNYYSGSTSQTVEKVLQNDPRLSGGIPSSFSNQPSIIRPTFVRLIGGPSSYQILQQDKRNSISSLGESGGLGIGSACSANVGGGGGGLMSASTTVNNTNGAVSSSSQSVFGGGGAAENCQYFSESTIVPSFQQKPQLSIGSASIRFQNKSQADNLVDYGFPRGNDQSQSQIIQGQALNPQYVATAAANQNYQFVTRPQNFIGTSQLNGNVNTNQGRLNQSVSDQQQYQQGKVHSPAVGPYIVDSQVMMSRLQSEPGGALSGQLNHYQQIKKQTTANVSNSFLENDPKTQNQEKPSNQGVIQHNLNEMPAQLNHYQVIHQVNSGQRNIYQTGPNSQNGSNLKIQSCGSNQEYSTQLIPQHPQQSATTKSYHQGTLQKLPIQTFSSAHGNTQGSTKLDEARKNQAQNQGISAGPGADQVKELNVQSSSIYLPPSVVRKVEIATQKLSENLNQ